jgi:hypothetical protein
MAFRSDEEWYLHEYKDIIRFNCCLRDFKAGDQCMRCRVNHKEPHCKSKDPDCGCPLNPELFPCCKTTFTDIKQCWPCRDQGLPIHCDECKNRSRLKCPVKEMLDIVARSEQKGHQTTHSAEQKSSVNQTITMNASDRSQLHLHGHRGRYPVEVIDDHFGARVQSYRDYRNYQRECKENKESKHSETKGG